MRTRISQLLAIDIRANLVTRMRSIGKTRKEIEQLNIFLEASLADVNDIAIMNRK